MKKLITFTAILALIASLLFVFSFARGEDVEDYMFSIEKVYADGNLVLSFTDAKGASGYLVTEPLIISGSVSVTGWLACEEGISGFQYSIDEVHWFDCLDPLFSERKDLSAEGIPYEAGHSTAGFEGSHNLIPASVIPEDHTLVAVRAVTSEGNYIEFLYFDDVSVKVQDTPAPLPTEIPAEPTENVIYHPPESGDVKSVNEDPSSGSDNGCGGNVLPALTVLILPALFMPKKKRPFTN